MNLRLIWRFGSEHFARIAAMNRQVAVELQGFTTIQEGRGSQFPGFSPVACRRRGNSIPLSGFSRLRASAADYALHPQPTYPRFIPTICIYIHISYILYIYIYISSFQSLFRHIIADPHQLNCCRATSPNSSRCSGSRQTKESKKVWILGQKGKTLTESKRAEANL